MSPREFWSNQPGQLSEKEQGVISTPTPEQFVSTPLPEGYAWTEVNDPEVVTAFLAKNYYSGSTMRLEYSKNLVIKFLSAPEHRSENSLGLCFQGELIGYVFGKEHTVVIEKKKEKLLSVNFLCLKEEFRSKRLAPLLIIEIKRIANTNGTFSAIFANDDNKGFSFTELSYYHLPLNTERLKKMTYLPHNFKETEFKMRQNTRLACGEDFASILEIYERTCKFYSIYEVFDQKQLTYQMDSLPNCNYTLYNPDSKEFVSFYIIETVSIKTDTRFRKAYLYYWGGSKAIFEDAFAYCRNELNVDMFDLLNMGRNELQVIEEFGFLMGTGHVFYHLFNYRTGLTPRSKVNFVLY